MTKRVIERQADGRWFVRLAENTEALSFHDRRDDALARVITILNLGGGGRWMVVDDRGEVIEEGVVEASPNNAAASA